MKHSLRVWAISMITLSAMICIAPVNCKADSFVTVGGTEYDVTVTPSESFTSAATLLEAQPWWGNETLAADFATAVGTSLGIPNGVPTPEQTPTFAYGLDTANNVVDNVDIFSGVLTDWTSAELGDTITPSYPFVFATATVVPAPAPETSSISLLLIGLGSLGVVMAMRKRKAQGLAQAA
jgi:hypothetical protein